MKCLGEQIPIQNINVMALKNGDENFLYSHPQYQTSKELYMPKILKGLEKTIEKMNKDAHEVAYKVNRRATHRNVSHRISNSDIPRFGGVNSSSYNVNDVTAQHQNPIYRRISMINQIEFGSMDLQNTLMKRATLRNRPSNQRLTMSLSPSDIRESQVPSTTVKANIIEQHEQKRWNHLLKQLPDQLTSPFKERKQKAGAKLNKKRRNDPVRRILATNQNISKQKAMNNVKLLKILERIELDRPILMKDKLDVIWGEEDLPPLFATLNESFASLEGKSPSPLRKEESMLISDTAASSSQPSLHVADQKVKIEKRIVNEHGVKRELERRKERRAQMNQSHIKVYNKLLGYIQNRFQRVGIETMEVGEKRNNPTRVRIHEKERQFFDAFKLIIQSGYTVDEKDFIQILHFINVEEVIMNEEYERIRQVREFLKTTARYLGFSEKPIEELFRASYFHYENAGNSIIEETHDEGGRLSSVGGRGSPIRLEKNEDEFGERALID